MNDIEPWCISRQIWWGHRIPAWYDENGNIFVAESEKDAVKLAKKKNKNKQFKLRQETDVLDTWFSSALWPFATLGWPNKTEELNKFYPTSVLVTGFDIIFFWVARMLMMGNYFRKNTPFHKVYVHALVRDEKGQKMSKSKGNVIDPLDVIEGISLDKLLEKRTSSLINDKHKSNVIKKTKRDFPDGIKEFGVRRRCLMCLRRGPLAYRRPVRSPHYLHKQENEENEAHVIS